MFIVKGNTVWVVCSYLLKWYYIFWKNKFRLMISETKQHFRQDILKLTFVSFNTDIWICILLKCKHLIKNWKKWFF